jgi:hypothetical protein
MLDWRIARRNAAGTRTLSIILVKPEDGAKRTETYY